MRRSFLYAMLAVLLAMASAVQLRTSWDTLRRALGASEEVAWPFGLAPYSRTAAFVGPQAAAAGLRPGDRVLAINEQPYRGVATLGEALAAAKPGDVLRARIAPAGAAAERDISVRLQPAPRWPLGIAVFFLAIRGVMPSICLLLGFWVALVRPRDPMAWMLLALMISFANIPGVDTWSWAPWFRIPALAYIHASRNLWAFWMLMFGAFFAGRLPIERRFWWLKWLVAAPLLVSAPLGALEELWAFDNLDALGNLRSFTEPIGRYAAAMSFLGNGLFFMFIGWKSGVAENPDARRRLRLLLYGSMVALTPSAFVFASALFMGQSILNRIPQWLMLPTLSSLLLFPLTLAYVIVVHRAMDVRMALRQGAQYALAQGTVRVAQVVWSAVVLVGVASLATDPAARRVDRVTLLAGGVALVFLAQRGSQRLKAWLDRRFFREAVNAEQVLADLSDHVRTIVETGPLLETVGKRVAESLHVTRVAFLVGEDGRFCPAYAAGYPAAPETCLSENSATAARLRQHGVTAVYLEDTDSWVYRTPEMTEEERAKLRSLDSQLLLPLAAQQRLVGILSLGPKRSEEPYSRSDVKLLESVAAQTGLALENGRLTQAIAQEVAQRERIHREIEIAREVQQCLFPQRLPATPGFDYAGSCRPAHAVGGDYYDFLALPGGALGIAIGDVSGKGIAAALLMASLQASLRGQTMSGNPDLAAVMRNVNRLVYDASASNRYATFFYGQYDPASRRLIYVNAGHNAPAILRASGETERLEQGGAVVGLLPDFLYQQGVATLAPGDTFVAFTDGVSEAMNIAEEEWGEANLLAACRACHDLSATDTLAELMEAADGFAGGAPQHDDMTLIVGKVVGLATSH